MESYPDLQVTNLIKQFQTQRAWFGRPASYVMAVNGISLTLSRGEILGFLGTNGAGKTTTVQMLLGLMEPTSGKIEYFGKDFKHNRSEILNSVGFASTYVKLATQLTVYENLDMYGRLYGMSQAERAAQIKSLLTFFEMWNYKDRDAQALSAGQVTRVMLAKAFLAHPRVVLLDEPTASLDPDVAQAVVEFIKEQRKQRGVSILFTSHNMDEVAELCDRVLVLDRGSIIADNTPQELARTVSNAHMILMITQGADQMEAFCNAQGLQCSVDRQYVRLEVAEDAIPRMLVDLAQRGIHYSYIAIERPTLKDYFLSITAARRTKEKS